MRKLLAALLCAALALCALPAMGDTSSPGYSYAATPLDGASEGVISNISKAIGEIDGLYIPLGGSFSFNDTVGPRTKDYGYVRALNGRGKEVYGGGVSQVATTLYLALLDYNGVTYNDFHVYGDRFTGSYVSDGEMAVVTSYSRDRDFAFTNDEADMVISMWIQGDELCCQIACDGAAAGSPYEGYARIVSASIELGGTEGLISNVTRAAGSIDGLTLAHGDTFSFNEAVGPRTSEHGYVDALNGRGVKVCGGGVAQVASVIWLAVENLEDITIVEKSTYGKRYNQSYVASSADAILTDYNADTDFSFRNMRNEGVVIHTFVKDDLLTCEIYVEEHMSGTDPVEEPILSW
jgi:vancomycin resistance protein YoaR